MSKIQLYNGGYIDKAYFEDTLSDLSKEVWTKKPISELSTDHVNCLLSMETISKERVDTYYESNRNNIVSVEAFNHYLKGLVPTGI